MLFPVMINSRKSLNEATINISIKNCPSVWSVWMCGQVTKKQTNLWLRWHGLAPLVPFKTANQCRSSHWTFLSNDIFFLVPSIMTGGTRCKGSKCFEEDNNHPNNLNSTKHLLYGRFQSNMLDTIYTFIHQFSSIQFNSILLV